MINLSNSTNKLFHHFFSSGDEPVFMTLGVIQWHWLLVWCLHIHFSFVMTNKTLS
jgi:hypothetical protein